MRLNGVESLEVQNRFDETGTGRITVVNGLYINPQYAAPFGPVCQHLFEGLSQQICWHVRVIESFTDPMDHRILQRTEVQNRRIMVGGKHGIIFHCLLCFGSNGIPDRVHGLDLLGTDGFVGNHIAPF